MQELKLGDYVRLNDGYIDKYHTEKENVREYRWQGGCDIIKKEVPYIGKRLYFNVIDEIIKSSPNIIDLIEVGDYVNGLKVIDILENDIYISDYYAESYIGVVKEKNIKSIVTKEQFEAISYKL